MQTETGQLQQLADSGVFIVDGEITCDDELPTSATVKQYENRMEKRAVELRAQVGDEDNDGSTCQKYFVASRCHFRAAPVIHMALDASEVGGKNRMLGFVTWLGQLWFGCLRRIWEGRNLIYFTIRDDRQVFS